MRLNIPERGVNLRNADQAHLLARYVALWVMAQRTALTPEEINLCHKLSSFSLGMTDDCWIRRSDYHILMNLDQPDHYLGRNINGSGQREYVAEMINWFRREYTRQNPEFLFEMLDV
jgi:hypothetical protein